MYIVIKNWTRILLEIDLRPTSNTSPYIIPAFSLAFVQIIGLQATQIKSDMVSNILQG